MALAQRSATRAADGPSPPRLSVRVRFGRWRRVHRDRRCVATLPCVRIAPAALRPARVGVQTLPPTHPRFALDKKNRAQLRYMGMAGVSAPNDLTFGLESVDR